VLILITKFFREEAGIQDPVMFWPCKSNEKKIRGRHQNLNNWGKFCCITQSKVIFSAGYWKTSIKEDRIAKKLKMRTCGKIAKFEIVLYWFFVTRWVDLSKVCIC